MSLLSLKSKTGSATPLAALVQSIKSNINEQGVAFANARNTELVTSMESLTNVDMQLLNDSAVNIETALRDSFATIAGASSLGFEELSATQMEAAVICALAAGNPAAYADAAMRRQASSSDNIPVISVESGGVAGRLDYRMDVSVEAFDETQLANMLPYSIVFNAQASRQDEFSETFYPTTVVGPDNGGIDISVNRTTVFNAVRHASSGKPTNFNQRNLVEAAIDASILADESTAIVPFKEPSGEADAMFVDPTAVTPWLRKVGDVNVETAPLRVGRRINLLGISSHPQLVGAGVLDHTDSIDARIELNKVYVQSQETDPADRATFSFNVSRLPRRGFKKSVEGTDREMTLNFRTEALVLNSDSTAMDGTAPAQLQLVRDNNYTVRLSVSMNGDANVEFGNVQINPTPLEVVSITDEDGNEIALDAGAGQTIADTIEAMVVIGYDLNASRTNSNRRTRGLLLNNIRETERFEIQLGAPISAPSPIGTERDARDLDSLIAAARIRNSNNAVTTLLNYADTLRSYVVNKRHYQGVPNIEGVGRHVVVPFYEEMDLNISEAINSIKSKDRAEDISAVLVNAIRDITYRMYRDSGYQAALDASGTGSKRPSLVVGTDPVLQRHLIVQGDNRTFGVAFDNAKMVTTLDSRMDNKIILTFTREGTDGQPDPLSFGTHAWIPELATSVKVARDGAHYQEAMVQPRSRHINNLPIMAVINVTGLTDVMTSNVPQTTTEVP